MGAAQMPEVTVAVINASEWFQAFMWVLAGLPFAAVILRSDSDGERSLPLRCYATEITRDRYAH